MELFTNICCTGILITLAALCNSRDYNYMCYFHALMERPCEPLNYPKARILFILPPDHRDDRFEVKDLDTQYRYRVHDVQLPDLNLTFHLRRDQQFSTFVPLHRKMAAQCIDGLLEIGNPWEVLNAAAIIRDKMNCELWTFCIKVVLIHHTATKGKAYPALHHNAPQHFFQGSVLQKAREEVSVFNNYNRTIIHLPPTATDIDPEHHLWYFREDVGINLHHWNWHLTYPYTGKLVYKNRRGELFYYLHQQIIARYNFERLCNKLNRVKPLDDFRAPIKEGYFSKLNQKIASLVWPARTAHSTMSDVNRGDFQILFEIGRMERWRDNIYKAIYEGRAMKSNYEYVSLLNSDGIDILGNMLESSDTNVNTNLYGNLHNMGHIAIASIHDPDNKYLEPLSVMGNTATAMRDPVFYRWHKFIDNIYQEHKATLLPHPNDKLQFPDIFIHQVTVESKVSPPQKIFTYWDTNPIELSRGLDFAPRGMIYAKVKHLQHAPFTYVIKVVNDGPSRKGTVRIFMAPKLNEQGDPFTFLEQRVLFIELDRFVVDLRHGLNHIERSSQNSSVTIPFSRTFRQMDEHIPVPTDDEVNFCGCGWPDHMLIPKGTPEGFQTVLFIMISDYKDDHVAEAPPNICERGSSYCGHFDRKYPDARPMGFPFDRPSQNPTQSLDDFLTRNMFVTNVTIQFNPDFLDNSSMPLLDLKRRRKYY